MFQCGQRAGGGWEKRVGEALKAFAARENVYNVESVSFGLQRSCTKQVEASVIYGEKTFRKRDEEQRKQKAMEVKCQRSIFGCFEAPFSDVNVASTDLPRAPCYLHKDSRLSASELAVFFFL